MKNFFTCLYTFLLLICISPNLFSQIIGRTYPDVMGEHGFNLSETRHDGVQVIFSVEEFAIFNKQDGEENWHEIFIPGIFLPNDQGTPELPMFGRYVALPKGADISFEVAEYRYETFTGIEIIPSSGIPLDQGEDLQRTPNNLIYNTNSLWPGESVTFSEPQTIRGLDVVMLGISPFQYNPVTKELKVYYDIKINISFNGGHEQWYDQRYSSRWWDTIQDDFILNYSQVPRRGSKVYNDATGYEYLIITPDKPEFLAWADTIKEFRTRQGIKTAVKPVTETGGNTVSAITSYITNAYENWEIPPVAVLLLGDYHQGEDGITSPRFNHNNAGFGGTYITDNRYSDMTGNNLPDIVFSRITANCSEELENMITKFIEYESNPPENPSFYQNPISATGWQTDRWFQVCSEVVGGFWSNSLGKETQRINAIFSGNPDNGIWSTADNTEGVLNYFGQQGLGYIPDSPVELGNWRDARAVDMNRAINQGAFMIIHRDHGEINGWSQPHYRTASLGSLRNEYPPFVLSINCLTGRFDFSGESFAERFHRLKTSGVTSGALGLIAATQVSFSFVNDAFVWGIIDNMWPDFMPDYGTNNTYSNILPAFASVGGKYFLEQSSWPSNPDLKSVTYDLFHHHGDAFLKVYSEVPTPLYTEHYNVIPRNQDTFRVAASENSFIALTWFCPADNETKILATSEGTGDFVDMAIIDFPQGAENLLLTITRQNNFRYEENIRIIPEEGPYVITNGFSVTYSQGESYSEAACGSSFYIDLNFINAGNQPATELSATIISNDQYVLSLSLNEDVAIGDLLPDEMHSSSGSFYVELSTEIPDNYLLEFEAVVQDGESNIFTDTFQVRVKAPAFSVVQTQVSYDGENFQDYVYPGSDAVILVNVKNQGSLNADAPLAALIADNPYVSITGDATYTGEDLEPGQIDTYSFPVSISPNIPNGEIISLGFLISGCNSTLHEFSLSIGSPQEFDLGADTLTARNFPFNNRFTSNRSQMLYLVEEIGMGSKTISALSFNFSNASQSPNYQQFPNLLIRMKNTPLTALGGDFEPMDEGDTLFFGTSAQMPSTTGWFTFDIEPFDYSFFNGNIIIDISWSNFNSTTTDSYQVVHTDMDTTMVVFGSSDDTFYPNYPAYSASSVSRPNLRLHYINSNPPQEKDVVMEVKNIVDSETVGQASITVGTKTISTGTDGRGSITLYDGFYNLMISHNDFHPFTNSFQVNSQQTFFPFLVDPIYKLDFIITDNLGYEIQDATITIDDQEFYPGEYYFDQFMTGTFDYQVSRQGYFDASGQFELLYDYNPEVIVVMQTDYTRIEANIIDNGIMVYPNPVKDVFYLGLPLSSNFSTFSIYNSFGQLVKEGDLPDSSKQANKHQINISHLPPGSYIIHLPGDHRPVPLKIIKY